MSKRKTLNEPILFVVSAPSGAGKTTLVEELLKKDKRLHKTTSHTTRPRRSGEKDGRDYFFVSKDEFEALKKKGAFLESAKVYQNKYATSLATVEEGLQKGKDVVLVIEGRGARSVRRIYGKKAVFVLILPPSIEELRRRLVTRGEGSKSERELRLAQARAEIGGMDWFDYVIVNDDLDQSVEELAQIMQAERRRLSRNRKALEGFEPKA